MNTNLYNIQGDPPQHAALEYFFLSLDYWRAVVEAYARGKEQDLIWCRFFSSVLKCVSAMFEIPGDPENPQNLQWARLEEHVNAEVLNLLQEYSKFWDNEARESWEAEDKERLLSQYPKVIWPLVVQNAERLSQNLPNHKGWCQDFNEDDLMFLVGFGSESRAPNERVEIKRRILVKPRTIHIDPQETVPDWWGEWCDFLEKFHYRPFRLAKSKEPNRWVNPCTPGFVSTNSPKLVLGQTQTTCPNCGSESADAQIEEMSNKIACLMCLYCGLTILYDTEEFEAWRD